MKKRGLFIGRFNPPHKVHIKIIKDLLEKVDELTIVVGSAQYSHQLRNPFTAGERIEMIKLALEEAGISLGRCLIIPVPDTPAVHSLWVPQVKAYVPSFDIVFSNEPLTRRLFEEAGIKVEPIPFYKREVFSSTEVRKRMLEGGNWEELVPNCVANFIKKIGGVERLQELAKTDTVSSS
jgi:nicotinamide-nucleotide adenylyltransferase